jgi:hypothetical protein
MRVLLIVAVVSCALTISAAQNTNALSQESGVNILMPSTSQSMSPLQQQILQAEKDLLSAMERGDINYVKNAIADDYIEIGSTGDFDHKSAIFEGMQSQQSHPHKKEPAPTIYSVDILPLNDSAAIIAYDLIRPGEQPRYLHRSHTWVKVDNTWKLKFEQSTPNRWSATDFD